MQTQHKISEKQAAVLPALLAEAAFGGWNDASLHKACGGELESKLLFPQGISDAVVAYTTALNDEMEAHCLNLPGFATLKIRQKIREGLWFRLQSHQRHREATLQLMSYYALPHHLPAASQHAWAMADRLWYLAGDTATDYNYYTKRTLLAGIYSASLFCFVTDHTPDLQTTSGFLDRRIENVMQFESLKHKVKGWFQAA